MRTRRSTRAGSSGSTTFWCSGSLGRWCGDARRAGWCGTTNGMSGADTLMSGRAPATSSSEPDCRLTPRWFCSTRIRTCSPPGQCGCPGVDDRVARSRGGTPRCTSAVARQALDRGATRAARGRSRVATAGRSCARTGRLSDGSLGRRDLGLIRRASSRGVARGSARSAARCR